jgi:hypothetical protein
MQSWLAEVEPTHYDEFIRVFWTQLRSVSDDLPLEPLDGIGDLPGMHWPLSYAVDASARFAAFRGFVPGTETSTMPLQFETFFICPQSARPRVGLRLLPFDDVGPPPTAPAWWTTELALPTTPHTGLPLPGFLELAAILAANGNVATTSAEVQGTFVELSHELAYYRQLAGELSEDLRRANIKVRDLIARPVGTADTEGDIGDAPEPAITDLSGLPEWAAQNAYRIVVTPRALGAAKKSLYENPPAVYEALELLAGAYRESRLGMLGKAEFEEVLKASGFQLRGSTGQPGLAGKYGDGYFVAWNGRRRVMDLHLVKGGGRDARYCLRVYFFWDDDSQKSIVGWLPGHLDNSLT